MVVHSNWDRDGQPGLFQLVADFIHIQASFYGPIPLGHHDLARFVRASKGLAGTQWIVETIVVHGLGSYDFTYRVHARMESLSKTYWQCHAACDAAIAIDAAKESCSADSWDWGHPDVIDMASGFATET